MYKIGWFFCLGIWLCSLNSSALAAERIKLAVLDLSGKGVSKDLSDNLTDVVAASLNRLGVFDVLSRTDIQRMLEFEQDKQMLGCESDTSCLAEVGGALGVALLVSGSIGKVGSSYMINLTLTDTATVTVRARESRQVNSENELTSQLEATARFLVRMLLEGQQGFLILKTSENGSDVEMDGRIIGVTPLARLTLSGGPHTLKVIKTGFITWAKDIDIVKNQPLIIEAQQIPSTEFIEAYEQRASTWRTLAYVAGGIGVAGVGFGIGGWVWNNSRAKTYEKDVVAANCQAGATGPALMDSCSSFQTKYTNIQRFDAIALTSGIIGTVALGTGIYLFFAGPSPGAYDQYKPSTAGKVTSLQSSPSEHPTVSFSLVPHHRGGSCGIQVRY